MDGVHDLGGRQGFGKIRYAPGAPAFHADWEKRVNALYGMAVRHGIFNRMSTDMRSSACLHAIICQRAIMNGR